MTDPVLSFYRMALRFRAEEPVAFAPGQAANRIRGGFGMTLKRLACLPDCEDAKTCAARTGCLYARLFEPSAEPGQAPSGFRDLPRPFVLRPWSLDGRRFAAGQTFSFCVHVFETRQPELVTEMVPVFAHWAATALGREWGAARLVSATLLDLSGAAIAPVFDGRQMLAPPLPPPLQIPLLGAEAGVTRLRVHFATPVDLKGEGFSAEAPGFGTLFARLRDRLSSLSSHYGGGPLDLPFREMGERARLVECREASLRPGGGVRMSGRTGQRHYLTGLLGEVEYEGSLDEFLPWLRAGEWTGVGRHTVWGLGQIRVLSAGGG